MKYREKRIIAVALGAVAISLFLIKNPGSYENYLVKSDVSPETSSAEPVANNSTSASDSELTPLGETESKSPLATEILKKLEIKGRASKTGYARTQFYSAWPTIDGCSLRQKIIKRELGDSAVISSEDGCTVISGEYDEPYTGSHLIFYQKSDLTSGVQIDHVVALSDAWQKGAQKLTKSERYNLATDPLNLLAVDAKTNQGKSDGDAASWLPPNKSFRCAYVARQVSVKYKYSLWVSQAEHDAILKVLETCPNERAVGV
ncbi:HNH endonuclease [Candidatus Saccharibacteria bacterium]|nr:HNH endonuclease [Candidatus Saccharibacteria bacterium]